ncbi:hypothetical protein QFZ56_005782 [Streptomyces achromogenes]|uniref:Uncharacterized protein n=1 Tax=Streptomyces achromogenes TaxID=67255 RepID=A0ABU0Q885_STRAH|nr:hypothetical protein [Streptomyces achromogenes]
MPGRQFHGPAHTKRQGAFAWHLRQYDRLMHTYRIGNAAVLPGFGADAEGRLVHGGNPAAERDERP